MNDKPRSESSRGMRPLIEGINDCQNLKITNYQMTAGGLLGRIIILNVFEQSSQILPLFVYEFCSAARWCDRNFRIK